ncbi:MAG: hydantoinase/oxoprolinase family protein [Gammaproteobacteria bacterium]|nr:hydantoinase/oxoprolinase family protein [Gammaproteobacteria bacterium]
MAYRLGVDVGGTFTDLTLLREEDGHVFTAKVPSTPDDPSRAVLNGIEKICRQSNIARRDITHVMHGTTVATNAVLTGNGARVGLITTRGFKQILHIGRSFVPGGLGGWVIYQKPRPLAPLKWTLEATERMSAQGAVVTPLDEAALRRALPVLRAAQVEAITVALINSFANGTHERRIRDILREELPGIPISISSEVISEMQEYERAITTVVNSYVGPVVGQYIATLQTELDTQMGGVKLGILKSDGGLAGSRAAADYPVNLLMSGPAGGVAGAIWVAEQAGFNKVMTFDMGGTSTDVALIENGAANLRRETRIGDVVVRASSVDVRTVGAGGGSIARVPELTGALRVGPQSAGAVPGPAAYGQGGEEPTVTDANVVLGYLPERSLLGGDMQIDRSRAAHAVEKIANAMDLSLEEAAAGIIDIVNENMFGALRLISIEQGRDPREFALMGFGGAGPLHANALAILTGAWPVIIPRGPGVLCAYGDVTTQLRNEASRTYIRRFAVLDVGVLSGYLLELEERAVAPLLAEGYSREDCVVTYQCDLRYSGQSMDLTLEVTLDELATGLTGLSERFDTTHQQLFTFALPSDKELINLRAVAVTARLSAHAPSVAAGTGDPAAALIDTQPIYVNGAHRSAGIYDRSRLAAGDRIVGPAIVVEMDSTTLILPEHTGTVDLRGNILIRPS